MRLSIGSTSDVCVGRGVGFQVVDWCDSLLVRPPDALHSFARFLAFRRGSIAAAFGRGGLSTGGFGRREGALDVMDILLGLMFYDQ